MYKPKCTNPILLFNKYCLTMVQNGADLVIDGVTVKANKVLSNHLPIHEYLQSARSFSLDQLDNSYCQLGDIKEPVFMYVPCGKCDLCMHSKQVDIINRTTLESMTWDTPPFFFTLTYDNAHLPCLEVGNLKYPFLNRGELRYKDVQDFFKRLRIGWTRKGLKHDIRYLVAGEYGHKYGRPHYHVILFNNPYHADELSPHLFNQLKLDIFNAWNKCEWQAFDFGQCRGGAAPYATKYVLKPQVTHGHHTKPFVRMSSGHRGGLGSIFLRDYVDYLRDNPSVNYLEYTDKLGRYQYMYLSKSFTNKVWKSPNSTVPANVRNLYKQFIDALMLMSSVSGVSNDDAFWLSEVLRPSKFVRNSFVVPHRHYCMGVLQNFYIKRIGVVLDGLIDDLSNKLVDDDNYVANYYAHKSFFIPQDNDNLAPLVSKVRQQMAILLDKSKF